MAHPLFANMGSLIDLLAVVILIAASALLYSAHKSFKEGELTVITVTLLTATVSLTALRLVALFDTSVFRIENTTFYRAVFALIAALAFLVFAVKFYEFAKQYGFGMRLAKKSPADAKIAKALGGE